MLIEIIEKSNKALFRHVEDLQKQQRYAQSRAINDTLKAAHVSLKAEVKKTFNRPTAWFVNSTRIGFANKQNPVGFIQPKDGFGWKMGQKPEDYYMVHVYGGKRPDKRSEKLLKQRNILPSRKNLVMARFGIRKNKNGNITRGQMNKILSGLRAQNDPQQNSPFNSEKSKRWFYGEIKGVRGIWQVNGRNPKLWFLEVDRAVYRKRLDYFGTINRSVESNFEMYHARWIDRAIRTAR